MSIPLLYTRTFAESCYVASILAMTKPLTPDEAGNFHSDSVNITYSLYNKNFFKILFYLADISYISIPASVFIFIRYLLLSGLQPFFQGGIYEFQNGNKRKNKSVNFHVNNSIVI
jgi:hypothetical protein